MSTRAICDAVRTLVRALPDDERVHLVLELADGETYNGGTTPTPASWIGTEEVARHLNMKAQWVRDNGLRLGGIRVGDGPKPRWRFTLAEVDRRMAACSASKESPLPVRPVLAGISGSAGLAVVPNELDSVPQWALAAAGLADEAKERYAAGAQEEGAPASVGALPGPAPEITAPARATPYSSPDGRVSSSVGRRDPSGATTGRSPT